LTYLGSCFGLYWFCEFWKMYSGHPIHCDNLLWWKFRIVFGNTKFSIFLQAAATSNFVSVRANNRSLQLVYLRLFKILSESFPWRLNILMAIGFTMPSQMNAIRYAGYWILRLVFIVFYCWVNLADTGCIFRIGVELIKYFIWCFSKFVLKFSVLMALKEVGQKTVRENFST
jgi:hypothetical protein